MPYITTQYIPPCTGFSGLVMSKDNRKVLGKVHGYCFYFVIIQKRATFLDFFYFCGQFVINIFPVIFFSFFLYMCFLPVVNDLCLATFFLWRGKHIKGAQLSPSAITGGERVVSSIRGFSNKREDICHYINQIL